MGKLDEYASPEEFSLALKSLNKDELAKLALYARYRTRGLEKKAGDVMGPESLMSEAVVRTLEGTRKWRKSVDVLMHLTQTMRSISSHWRRALKEGTGPAEAIMERVDFSVFEESEPANGSPEDRLYILEDLRALKEVFVNQGDVLGVITMMGDGFSKEEICRTLKIQENDFEAVRKRISRGIIKLREQGKLNYE